jgi:hypothetical protein
MGKIFIIIFEALMTTLFLPGVYAQDKPDGHFNRESFLVRRNAFITMELSLTPKEVEGFLPLLEELEQRKYEAGQKCRAFSKEVKQKKNPNNTDYLKTIDECIEVGIKEAELEKAYYEKFKKILSPEKLYKYKEVEYRFAREFVKNSGRPDERGRRDERK